jgi:sugar phosphate isomerase/epimerase
MRTGPCERHPCHRCVPHSRNQVRLQAAGANPATWLRKLKGRVPLMHLKDMTIVDGRAVQTEVGNGNLDWAEIPPCEAGTEWLIVEQDETERDSLESLAISFRNRAELL